MAPSGLRSDESLRLTPANRASNTSRSFAVASSKLPQAPMRSPERSVLSADHACRDAISRARSPCHSGCCDVDVPPGNAGVVIQLSCSNAISMRASINPRWSRGGKGAVYLLLMLVNRICSQDALFTQRRKADFIAVASGDCAQPVRLAHKAL